jgi:hypothetical protein
MKGREMREVDERGGGRGVEGRVGDKMTLPGEEGKGVERRGREESRAERKGCKGRALIG